jgi:hypothetical protein
VPKPVLQALLIADKVYQDLSGKKIIAGTFNRLIGLQRPQPTQADGADETGEVGAHTGATSPDDAPRRRPMSPAEVLKAGSPSVYISLTDVVGKVRFTLRYVDLRDNSALLEVSFDLEGKDRLATNEVVLPVPPLPIPHEGVFALELLCADELLGSHRITATVKHE